MQAFALRRQLAVLAGGPVLALFRDQDDRGSPPLNTADPYFLDPLDRPAVDGGRRLMRDRDSESAPGRILLLDCGNLPEQLPEGLVHRPSSPAELIGLKDLLLDELQAPRSQRWPNTRRSTTVRCGRY